MYYQPKAHTNITICGAIDLTCIVKVVDNIVNGYHLFRCDHCIRGCFSLTYDPTMSMAKIFDRVPFLQQKRLDPKNVAIVHVYYDRSTFRAHKKQELVGFTDFLSNIGGLLSLFMGFSLFSLIEIFYYLTIHPYCNYLRFAIQRRRANIREMDKKIGPVDG